MTCHGCDREVRRTEPYVVDPVNPVVAVLWHVSCWLEQEDVDDESPFDVPELDPKPQG
jgi:hypothetical protein